MSGQLGKCVIVLLERGRWEEVPAAVNLILNTLMEELGLLAARVKRSVGHVEPTRSGVGEAETAVWPGLPATNGDPGGAI